MIESVPVVEIVNPKNAEEKVVINASDYDAEKHTLWADKDKPKVARKEEKASAAPPSDKGFGTSRGRE